MPTRTLLTPLATGIALIVSLTTPSLAHAEDYPSNCPAFFPDKTPPEITNKLLAQKTTFLCNEAYAVRVSAITKTPLYSSEVLTKEGVRSAQKIPRPPSSAFRADIRLPPDSQASLSDYRGSHTTYGIDRGHMTPSGDAPTESSRYQTFLLSNIAPQASHLNEGTWADIEQVTRDLAIKYDQIYVATGPIFHSKTLSMLGQVYVPTAFYKAEYIPQINAAGAYVCSNSNAPHCTTISISKLEEGIGINIFPSLPDNIKQTPYPLPHPKRK